MTRLMRNVIVSVIFLCAAAIGAGKYSGWFQASTEANIAAASTAPAASGVTVSFIDVGQGDSELIQTPDGNVLIDSGDYNARDALMKYLKSAGVTGFECVVATHPHSDHISNIWAVLDAYPVKRVIMPDVTDTTETFKKLLTTISQKKTPVTKAAAGDEFSVGGARFTILAPNSKTYTDMNDYSVVLRMQYGATSFLFTGDAQTLSEGEMLKNGCDLSADVLKVGHHGSATNSGKTFVKAVSPQIAVISCGENNVYGFPKKSTLNTLGKSGAKLYRTDLNGTIVVTSDGKALKAVTSK